MDRSRKNNLTKDELNNRVTSNMGLVGYIAKRYVSTDPADSLEDIISIGTIGLIKAAYTFDEGKAIKFSTYAIPCISNEIKMHYRKVKGRVYQNTSLYDVVTIDHIGNELTREQVIESGEDIEFQYQQKAEYERLLNVIVNLKKKEAFIILLKLDGNTQKQIGYLLNYSQSYISRIDKNSIKKIAIKMDAKQANNRIKVVVDDELVLLFYEKQKIKVKRNQNLYKNLYQILDKI